MKYRSYKKYEKIYRKSSKIHGVGVFAVSRIRKGEKIIPYTGRKITKSQAERSKSSYLFFYNGRYDIDGRNAARYINHSCDPNCKSVTKNGQIWIHAIRDISKGEELAYNYGYDFKDYEDAPCVCAAKGCVGYILAKEHWKRLERAEQKKLLRSRPRQN